MRWIKGLVGYWESSRRRGRLARHADAFHAACQREGEPVLTELHELGYRAWDEGWGRQALEALHRVDRERRRKAS
jgi:hypothetical protein